jgi:hypothetical protein
MFDVLSALASTVMRMSVSRLLAERDESGRQRVKQRETAQSVPRTSRAFEAVCHPLAELQRGALGGGVAADAGALAGAEAATDRWWAQPHATRRAKPISRLAHDPRERRNKGRSGGHRRHAVITRHADGRGEMPIVEIELD